MSRGFVKEDDLERAGTDLPERPLSPHPNYVTPNGLKQLEQQASKLEQERVPLALRKEDPVAQQRLAMIDRDLRYLQARLESAIPVEPGTQPADTVLFGTSVAVEDEDGNHHTFMIVGEDEADIAINRVSWVSPLARALIGQKVGDSVIWHRPAGDLELEIVAVHY
ncbi:Transcription elongation factor, GreA/GreB family [Methylobacillus rhizosphaerae]|uniref:Transcription elongation factor, GreA/GreB family n=1 Tax=Methylobacillus rhizosphaerae TaxID=551994 RepID=A0A238YUC5_9PROT|nr:GreA/GreB family elongation factor [Methylobacillus rhizosphaerae]SNR74244.1 Transcription elongation factor, GreA/GreB family [Methylobacillus rhizosphaerae]